MQISVERKLSFRHFFVSSFRRFVVSPFRLFAFSTVRRFALSSFRQFVISPFRHFVFPIMNVSYQPTAFITRQYSLPISPTCILLQEHLLLSPPRPLPLVLIFICTRKRELTCNSDVSFKASSKQIVHSVLARCLPSTISR